MIFKIAAQITAGHNPHSIQENSVQQNSVQAILQPVETQESVLDTAPQDCLAANSVGSSKAFPLAMASVGDRLSVAKLNGSEGTVRRLIGMGFLPGMEVQIVNHACGSLVIAIADNRIGLGVGMAQKILCTAA